MLYVIPVRDYTDTLLELYSRSPLESTLLYSALLYSTVLYYILGNVR
jgi:hypothetical protein